MIEHKYGKFTDNQFDTYKKELHNSNHWLLIYCEDKKYIDVDVDEYFESFMSRISSLNELLNESPVLVSLLVTLQEAKDEYDKEDFSWKKYRKLILDAHSLIDKL